MTGVPISIRSVHLNRVAFNLILQDDLQHELPRSSIPYTSKDVDLTLVAI